MWRRLSNGLTPDGTRLITIDQRHGAHVWDLSLLRRHLAQRGVDWNEPAPAVRSHHGKTLRLRLDAGNR
jgi:hypothetical protein